MYMDGVKHKGTTLRKVSFEKNKKIVWISIVTYSKKAIYFCIENCFDTTL